MHTRKKRRPALTLGTLLALGAGLLAGARCGGGGLDDAYASYKEQVEPLLEQEAAMWTRVEERQRDVGERTERYFAFLKEEARPFYAELVEEVEGIDPGHERLAAAHRHLRDAARARLAFLHVSIQAEPFSSAAGGLRKVVELEERAHAAQEAYYRSVGDDVPDARYSELLQLLDGFAVDYAGPLREGRIDPEAVEQRLSRHLLPRIEELRNTRFQDDERSQALRAAIVGFHDYYLAYRGQVALIGESARVFAEGRRAFEESRRGLEDFREQLKQIRRDL